MSVHRRVTPSSKFVGTHLYTWVESGTVRVKCFAQEHNAVTLGGGQAKARTRTARSGTQRSNHIEGHHASHYAHEPTIICGGHSVYFRGNKLPVMI